MKKLLIVSMRAVVLGALMLLGCGAVSQSAQAAGHVTRPTEAAFNAALAGGGKVVFDTDATINPSCYL